MTDITPSAAIAFALSVVLASATGVLISRRLPWSDKIRLGFLPFAFGLGLGPFLTGLLAIAALAALPGSTRGLHIGVVLGGLLAIMLVALRIRAQPPTPIVRLPAERLDFCDYCLAGILGLSCVGVLLCATVTPLTQNDALEYLSIGRILFEARDLAVTPVLEPAANSLGAYYPWTHPPLYVSLIYFVSLLQGFGDAPGLARLIAPWVLLAATCVVFGIARELGLRAALVASVLVVSTPLLFLGAGAALIDALPVLGFALLLAAINGCGQQGFRGGMFIGLALGLGLWTHSQAVLFVPLGLAALALRVGLGRPRTLLAQFAGALSVATLVGAWPYIRNLLLVGAPISDNTAVFAAASQNWPDYFAFNRGIDNWAAVVQYGVFKGWFALEAYGFSFWFMILGACGYWAWLRARGHRWRNAALTVPAGLYPIVWVCLGTVFCYLAGVVLSVVAGTDLMIKNERYMLIILPAVSLLVAFGLAMPSVTRSRLAGLAMSIALGVFTVGAGLQVLVLSRYALADARLGSSVGDTARARLWSQPPYQIIRAINESTAEDALILALRPGDMYYAKRRMLSFLDPRLLDFYAETTRGGAMERLRGLGVTHVQVTDYDLPPFFSSQLQAVLRDPALARLMVDASGYQLYELDDSGLRDDRKIDVSPERVVWSRSTNVIVGGRRALGRVVVAERALGADGISDAALGVAVFHRDRSTSLMSPPITDLVPGEYALDFDVEGNGAVRVYWRPALEDRLGAETAEPILLGDFFLSARRTQRSLSYRFVVPPGAPPASVEVEHLGSSRVVLGPVAVTRIVTAVENPG